MVLFLESLELAIHSSLGCPGHCGYPPTSASQILGLQACATKLILHNFLLWHYVIVIS